VQGTILDSTDVPVGNVLVEFIEEDGAQDRYSDVTDSSGGYSLLLGPSGLTHRGSGPTPACCALDQNYPNPFNPVTIIPFFLKQDAFIRLDVFDIRGRWIRTLVHGFLSAGPGRSIWDGTDDAGRGVTAGVYFCMLSVDGHRRT